MINSMLALLAAQAALSAPVQPAGGPQAVMADLALQAAPPAVRFAPFAVRVRFRVSPGHAVSDCAVELIGNPEPHWHDNPCRHIATSSFLALVGVDRETGGRMTASVALEADGRPADAGAVRGRLMFRSEARFQVRADGSISDCAVGEAVGTGGQLNLCQSAFPRRPNPFLPAAASSRSGLISMSFYLER
ncbi:MAG TPA: hypothetical protein VEX35_03375 [Allosphingosinicella sp.]|nr:hypothetical protein [Allosphingosinicella sp.]